MRRRIWGHPEIPETADLSQAVQVGPFLFCSGQIGIGPDGRMVSMDPEEQMAQAFKNLEKLLAQAGGTLADVVKVTSFLTDEAHRPALVRVRRQYFQEPYPASTLVVVKALARPEYLYELEAVAILDQEEK